MPLPDEIIQSLPEDVRGASAVTRYNDLPSMIKGYSEMEAYRGRSVAIPADDAKPEDIEKWKSEHMPKLGKVFADRMPPEKPGDYEFKYDGVDSEVLKTDKIMGAVRAMAHEEGLSKTQAANIFGKFAKDILPQLFPKAPEAQPQPELPPFIDKYEDAEKIIKEDFKGETTQRLDEFKKGANILFNMRAGLKGLFNEGVAPYGKNYMSLGDHPDLIWMVTEFMRMQNPDFSGGGAGTSDAALGAADAINDIKTNPNNPLHASYKKGWKSDPSGREKWDDLWRQTTGGR